MSRRGRKIGLVVAAAALVALFASTEHRADIRILTAEQGDPNPRRMDAAVDLGVIAVSVLVTWTSHLAR